MKWLKRTAQGFSPGNGSIVGPALQGRPNRMCRAAGTTALLIAAVALSGRLHHLRLPRAKAPGCIVGPLPGQKPTC